MVNVKHVIEGVGALAAVVGAGFGIKKAMAGHLTNPPPAKPPPVVNPNLPPSVQPVTPAPALPPGTASVVGGGTMPDGGDAAAAFTDTQGTAPGGDTDTSGILTNGGGGTSDDLSDDADASEDTGDALEAVAALF
jgi:hypothetical protein